MLPGHPNGQAEEDARPFAAALSTVSSFVANEERITGFELELLDGEPLPSMRIALSIEDTRRVVRGGLAALARLLES
jgi:hypothetical protein